MESHESHWIGCDEELRLRLHYYMLLGKQYWWGVLESDKEKGKDCIASCSSVSGCDERNIESQTCSESHIYEWQYHAPPSELDTTIYISSYLDDFAVN
jgi:hypothetical protein